MTFTRRVCYIIFALLLVCPGSCTGDKQKSPDGQGPGGADTQGAGSGGTVLEIDSAGKPEDVVTLTDISRGLQVWKAADCTQCHRIGDDPGGDKGPALTGIGDRLTREQLRALIRDPRSVNPNATMPAHNMSDEDLDYLTRYLSVLSSDTAAKQKYGGG